MKALRSLVVVVALFTIVVPAGRADVAPVRFAKDIAAFETADAKNPPPQGAVLFVGSSTIRKWTTVARDFPDLTVINRGFGGSQISDCIRYADRIVIPYKPRRIVFFCGGNDVNAGKSPEQVLFNFKEFVAKVRTALPDTPITYISINPSILRVKLAPQMCAANKLIADYCARDKGLLFIDSYSKLLSKVGEPRAEILQSDQLHLNDKGYELLTSIVRPFLADEVPRDQKANSK